MKRVLGLSVFLLGLACLVQTAAANPANDAVKADFLANLSGAQEKVLSLAKAVPEEKYSWRPAEGVRSVSEVYMHIAGANYYVLTFVGLKTPEGVDVQGMEKITDKAKVLEALEKSYDYLKKTIDGMSDADMDKSFKVFGEDRTGRATLLLLISHYHEHLGQSIAYARSNGVVPPWSAKPEGK
jgi:uncharacterized damage-inducible protein DinB